jgi:ankyrin repeat protein
MGVCASKQKTQPRTQNDPARLTLAEAVKSGYINDVARLLESGVDPNETKGRLRRTPLHWAVDNCNKEIVALLLNNGADPSIKDLFDQTALDLAELAGEKGKELIPLLEKAAEAAAAEAAEAAASVGAE